ncbi:MAG TPA: NYN domain-containing protein [Planctomycetaceae bacterium]|jgi:hypothetical protein
MSARILLIDGYNLLHAAGMGQRDYKPGDLLRCRKRLLQFLLSKLSNAEIRAATLVFDARDPPPDRPAEIVVSGLKVHFANPGGDADAMIQQWLSHHSTPRRVTLVSSDRALQRSARGCGAKFVGSDEFLNELERRRVTGGQRSTRHDDDSKPAGQLSDTQTAYWLKEFGDAAPVDSESEPSPEPESPALEKSAGKPATPKHGRPRQRRKSKLRDDAKPTGSIDANELEDWLKVFGGVSAETERSPDELRRADLERWLKQLKDQENKPRD